MRQQSQPRPRGQTGLSQAPSTGEIRFSDSVHSQSHSLNRSPTVRGPPRADAPAGGTCPGKGL